MTSFPPFFFASRGSFPAGTICKVLPRQRERSAFLETQIIEKQVNWAG